MWHFIYIREKQADCMGKGVVSQRRETGMTFSFFVLCLHLALVVHSHHFQSRKNAKLINSV